MRKAIVGGLLVAGIAIGGAVATPPAPAEAATKCTSNVYGYGGYSTCIGYIQQILQPQYHLVVDNSFGQNTREAVKAFQRGHGLTADGYVGPNTWKALCYQGKQTRNVAAHKAGRSAGCGY